MRKSPWLLTLLVLASCATEPKAPSAPPAKVTVYREPSSRDSIFPMVFSVDGQTLGGIAPGDALSFPVPPGDHKFMYELGVYYCTEDVQLVSGNTYVYKLAHGCVFELEEP